MNSVNIRFPSLRLVVSCSKWSYPGICGTDKHTFQGFTTQYGARKLEFPLIQGHENVGTVAAIGGNGKFTDFEGIPLKVGDRVVVGANVSCGKCYYCRHDFPYCCCENTLDYGNLLSAKNPPYLFGGWSQYMYIIPGSFLVKVPDDLPSEVAVLTEILPFLSVWIAPSRCPRFPTNLSASMTLWSFWASARLVCAF